MTTTWTGASGTSGVPGGDADTNTIANGTTSTATSTTTTTFTRTTSTRIATTTTWTATTTDRGERCDGSTDISFHPQSITAMSRSRITFSRGCEVDRCCVNGVCDDHSKPKIENGRTVCYTPLLGNVDEASVVLHTPRTPTSVELHGAHPLQVEGAYGSWWRSEAWIWSYMYERWRWSRDPGTGRWTFELTGRYRVCHYSWQVSSSCCRLVALGMDFQVLPLPVEWCSDRRWGCSDVGSPWEDTEVARLLESFQVRGFALQCKSEQRPDEEFFHSAPLLRQFSFDRINYANAWADKDSQNSRVAPAISQIATRFKCPVHTGLSPRPRQLWQAWSIDPSWSAAGASVCLQMWPLWWRGLHGGVRCCYDGQGVYIQEWPSRALFYNSKMSRWSWREEQEVEQVTCTSDPNGEACQIYKSRRPPIPPTNSLFGPNSSWEVPRPFGGGWGDPHCKSIDGLEFECNFYGEAVWAGCESWIVHAIAEQLGTSNATVITKIAVRYGSETLVAKLNASVSMEVDNETGLAPTRYTLLLNGTEPIADADGGAEGTYLTASGFANVLTIEDSNGNTVKASFLKDLIVLQVAPSDGCFNKTFGLSGNNNGNKSDDLIVRGTGEALPEDSSSSYIFEKFVMSYVITAQSQSLFPTEDFVPVNDSFTPTFVDELDLSECPADCNGNGACCLDASQGGEELVRAFTVATKDIEETNSEAVGFFDNLRPAFEEAPSLLVLSATEESRRQLRFVATDADGIAALSCNICPGENTTHDVTCSLSGIGTNSSIMVVEFKSLDYGSFSCFCEDSHGANATSITMVVEVDKTTSAEAWQKEMAGATRRTTTSSSSTTGTSRLRPSERPQDRPTRTSTTATSTTTTLLIRATSDSFARLAARASWQLLCVCFALAYAHLI